MNVKDFFTWLIQYDWEHFDKIEDAFEQSGIYREILDRFRESVELKITKI